MDQTKLRGEREGKERERERERERGKERMVSQGFQLFQEKRGMTMSERRVE